MGLFSFLNKNKQESTSGGGEFYSRAEEESQAARGRGKRKSGKSANEAVDPMLPEKKRARRRLIGAFALVLAVIIGLPMILDSEPKPLADDIAIQIPSKDKAVPLLAPSAISPASTAVPVPTLAPADQHEQTTPASDAAAATTTAVVPEKATPTAAAASASSANNKLDAKPAEPSHASDTAKPHVVEKAAVATETKQAKTDTHAADHATEKHDDARAEAILDGKDVDAAKSNVNKKAPTFVVQVAALASQDKVTELQGKLSGAGIKSYTQKVPTASGDRIRVRVGPFASKDEADNARAKIAKLGLGGKVVPS